MDGDVIMDTVYLLKVDERGRIVIPSEIRKKMGIRKTVRLHIEEGKIILEPAEDPLDKLSKLVKKVKIKASLEPELISKTAEDQLIKELQHAEQ